MPTRELVPYVSMRPRIEAQRAIATAERVAVGMGRMKPEDHQATVARWRRDASQEEERPDRAKLAAAARGAGIGFRTVSVAKAPAS